MKEDGDLNCSIGVATAILSATAPGACIEKDPASAARLARALNEDAAKIRDQDPKRYGFFANLPSLQDTEACLREIAYAMDTLSADGIVLFTRYGGGNYYLGHESFKPIWQELNRRAAVVFIHPTHPVDTNLVNPLLPQPMFDYPHETGRTAIDMITQGTTKVTRDCKIILSHAGGDLPYVVNRVADLMLDPYFSSKVGMSSEEIVGEAQKFYFDTALSANDHALPLLLKFAKKGHILFGSDFPNASVQTITHVTKKLGTVGMSDEQRASIDHDAGAELFPRLRKGVT